MTSKENLILDFIRENYADKAEGEIKVVSSIEGFNESYDFRVKKEGDVLVFDCPVYSFAKKAIVKYFDEGDFGREVSYVSDRIYYSDFGAVGDGKSHDFSAMQKTHEAANLYRRHEVYADEDAKYYIENVNGEYIEIRTTTKWDNAEIIIDDRFITDSAEDGKHRGKLFLVANDYNITYTVDDDPLGIIKRINENGGIHRGDKTMPLDLGFDALVMPIDETFMIYRRWGHSGKTGPGSPKTEVVLVHKNNEIDTSTDILWDYTKINKFNIFRADPEPIRLEGGIFTTIATRADMPWNYVGRGFWIQRSNVTIDGMVHKVENQPLNPPDKTLPVCSGGGPNYNGFLFPHHSNKLLVKNTRLSGHVHYRQGSYDIGGAYANDIAFVNCSQYNMYEKEDKIFHENYCYWGIAGTNGCKNVTYDHCEFSRFDAHAGVWNFRISDCKIGIINAVGGGVGIIENSTIFNTRILGLREDYAAGWDGELIIRNCHVVSPTDKVIMVTGAIHNAPMGVDTVTPNLLIENVTHNKGENFENLIVYGLKCDDSFFEGGEIFNNIKVDNTIVLRQPKGYEFKKISSHENHGFLCHKKVIEE